jgi:diadenylate cyclase
MLLDFFNTVKEGALRFTVWDIVDILLVATIIYGLMRITQGTRASQVLKGLGVFIVLAQLCKLLGLSAISWLLSMFIDVGVVILVIIFQPEVRRALERMGRGAMFDMSGGEGSLSTSQEVEEIEQAILNMSRRRIGALIVFENKTGLNEIIETGHRLNAQVSSELIENVFFPNAPLHDGAMIINGSRIVAAGCFLPLSDNQNIASELGTRHRAALGVSEISDATVLIVSEETGVISVAKEGTITRYLDVKGLRETLEDIYHTGARSSKRIGIIRMTPKGGNSA